MFAKMMGMGNAKNPAEILRDKLNERGFDAFIYESPMDLMKKQVSLKMLKQQNLKVKVTVLQ